MTAPRQCFVVLLPGTPPDAAVLLAAAAATLATDGGSTLNVIELVANDEPLRVPPALPAAATWHRCRTAGLHAADGEALLAAMQPALDAAGWRAGQPSLLLFPAGPAEALAARLAGRLGGAALGRTAGLRLQGPDVVVQRAAWGGRAQMELASSATHVTACWRPAASTAAATHVPQVEDRELQVVMPAPLAREPIAASEPWRALEGARLVVSGGRGMQGDEGFGLLGRLAQQLDAGLGGSLPAVDAGWVPVARQIGQSGKYVTPRAYFAVGISGTPQHLAGISPDTRILAVNKDPQAPIFGIAHTGVVADWTQLLPLLCEAVERELKTEPAR